MSRQPVPDHPQPDGEPAALQEEAVGKGRIAARPLSHSHRAIPRPETVLQAALAQKLLQGWMQNRHQTLFPLLLNVRNMPAAKPGLAEEVARGMNRRYGA